MLTRTILLFTFVAALVQTGCSKRSKPQNVAQHKTTAGTIKIESDNTDLTAVTVEDGVELHDKGGTTLVKLTLDDNYMLKLEDQHSGLKIKGHAFEIEHEGQIVRAWHGQADTPNKSNAPRDKFTRQVTQMLKTIRDGKAMQATVITRLRKLQRHLAGELEMEEGEEGTPEREKELRLQLQFADEEIKRAVHFLHQLSAREDELVSTFGLSLELARELWRKDPLRPLPEFAAPGEKIEASPEK